MNLRQQTDGRVHFVLGPVEKWVVGAVGTGGLALAWWLVSSVQTLLTQQAVTNQQLSTISAQIAGVPALGTQVAELKVRVDQHDQDIRELKQLREVK